MTHTVEEIREFVEQAWHRALGGDGPYADTDDFFQLGGHSLLALHVAEELGSRLGRPVSVRTMFTRTQLAQLVAALQAA